MSKIHDIAQDFNMAAPTIRQLIEHLNWIEENFAPSEATEEERSIVKHLQRIAYGEFNLAAHRINQMFRPVINQGNLTKNSRSKYEIQGWETSCNSFCEAYLPYRNDYDEGECMTWVPTAIEHNGEDYYFKARPQVPLEGVLVRIKG